MTNKILSPFILLLGMFLLQEKIHAQNNPPPPDCVIVLNNWTTAQSSSSFPNYFTACQTWTFQYTSVGFTGLTITVQSAPAATATTPSTFVTYAGTVSTGINPNTNTAGRITTFSNGLVDIPWIRVNLSGLTGTGTVFGVLYGYKTGYAGSGGGGGGGGTCSPIGTANQILTDTGALGCQSDVATLDSSGNLSTPASLSMVQSAAQPIIANSFGFQAPAIYTSALRLEPPNANPTANQFMLFPSPSSNISQWAWTTFVSTNLTDSANLVRNNQVNTGTSAMTLDMSASNSAAALRMPNLAGASSATNGVESYDTTNKNVHMGANGVDNVAALFPSTALPADQNCIKASVSSSVVRLADAGSPCGSGGSGGTAGSPLAVQTTSVTVTSNAETSLIGTVVGSLTIPANWFTTAGTVMEVCASGTITTAAAAQGTVNFKLKFGTTVVAQTGAFTPTANLSVDAYDFCIRLSARTVGGTGTIMATNMLHSVGTTLITPMGANFTNPTPATAVVIDTTATQALDLTVTFSANATNSITQTNFYMVGPGSAVSSVNGLTGAIQTGVLCSLYTATDESTASTNYTDLATLDTCTFTLNATTNVLITYMADEYVTGSTNNIWNIVNIAGSDVAGTDSVTLPPGTSQEELGGAKYVKTSLGSGSQTVKIRHKVSGGTGHWLVRVVWVTVTP